MPYPIVLAHGVCRFDLLWSDSLNLDNNDDPTLDRLHYFKGIRTMLKAKGYSVYHSNVSWAANVDTRAEDLRRNVLNPTSCFFAILGAKSYHFGMLGHVISIG